LLARLVASCARGSFSEKTSIQMITLIALFRSIAMKAKPQNQKSKENMNFTDSFQKNTNSATSHRTGAHRARDTRGLSYEKLSKHPKLFSDTARTLWQHQITAPAINSQQLT